MRTFLVASGIGIVATLLLLALAYAADAIGYPRAAAVLFWQNGLLQGFAPLHNIGTPEHQVLEGSPLNFLAFLASIPLGFIVYGMLAYVVLRLRRRGA